MNDIRTQDRIANTAEHTRETATAVANDARTRIEAAGRQAADLAQDAYGQARDQALDAVAMITDSVKKQPIIALLIAGGIGCVLAMLLVRRR